MGFFKNLGDAFSGNTTHWTSTHNPIIGELFQRADTLSRNGPEVFKKLIVISSIAVEQLVFPKQGNALLNLDVKSITRSQFHQLYTVLLAFLVARVSGAMPQIAEDIKTDLLKVVSSENSSLANQVLEDIINAPSGASEGVRLWKSVTNALNTTNTDAQSQFIVYSLLVKSLSSGL